MLTCFILKCSWNMKPILIDYLNRHDDSFDCGVKWWFQVLYLVLLTSFILKCSCNMNPILITYLNRHDDRFDSGVKWWFQVLYMVSNTITINTWCWFWIQFSKLGTDFKQFSQRQYYTCYVKLSKLFYRFHIIFSEVPCGVCLISASIATFEMNVLLLFHFVKAFTSLE